MTFFMVLAMEFYNTGLRMGGMTNEGFFMAFSEMRFMVPVCFVMGYFFMDRIAPKIAFKMVTPGEDKEIFCIIVRAAVTVCLMCPVMSFWATLIFKQPGVQFLAVWLETIVINFPMASAGRFSSVGRWYGSYSGRFLKGRLKSRLRNYKLEQSLYH